MREKLGLLLMEEADGKIAVQLFEAPDKAAAAFSELKGKPGDPPSRATFLDIRFGEEIKAESRDLPAPKDPNWTGAWRLGVGPVVVPPRDLTFRENIKKFFQKIFG